MASIHIREIENLLAETGAGAGHGDGFLEIRFDEPTTSNGVADHEMWNKVLTTESPQGSVTMIFDDVGFLKSLDIC